MSKLKTEVSVGIMVTAGFLLLSFVVFGISGIYYFQPGYLLKAKFNFVGIIDKGAPVRYSGVKIGEVKKVEILEPTSSESGKVLLTFFVTQGVKIHENDKVSVQGTHIMAEPHIEIEPSKIPGRLLQNGDMVIGVDPFSTDLLVQQAQEIAAKINRFMDEVEKSFYESGAKDSMRQSIVNLSEILASLRKIIDGKEEDYKDGLSKLSSSADRMSKILDRIDRGEGTLGKLVAEEEIYNDLREFVKEIKARPWRLLKK